ncbi:Bestrophin domain containing protein [Trichuris trichiura]|uniref:Bestrophin homolog n=1 Tax=Trichuris trichiura TaxID=36087 RepID=A0A077Z753_TRITR|nr:Bestrophin domain containing protein [Trichuris trichiura]
MTISYSDNFGKLLLHWRGSLWKSIWKDLLVFLLIYYSINMVYRFALSDEQQSSFHTLVKYCDKATGLIPITFLLGFFVSMVVSRWWEQCSYVMWPDRFMCFVTAYIPGPDHLLLRRTIARWCNLASALCWRGISVRTLKRFPTIEHLVQSGLMTPEELTTFESTESPYGKWWLPLIWATNLIRQCYDAKIIDSILLRDLVQELHKYRSGFGMLVMYDWVTVPLVYTQVVAIATYGYFAICLIGRQSIGAPGEPDLYIPVFTILQFLFYIGWLKVGEDLMNPFGEDDDDFELNYVLDRNIQVAYLLAEDLNDQLPKPKVPLVPYTRGSLKKPDNIFTGHLTELKFKAKDMDFVEQGSLMEKQSTLSWPTVAMMK